MKGSRKILLVVFAAALALSIAYMRAEQQKCGSPVADPSIPPCKHPWDINEPVGYLHPPPGVPDNVTKFSAQSGNWQAQLNLFNFYMKEPHNYEEAYFWISLAASQTPGLDQRQADAEKRLTAEQVAAVKQRVAEWHKAHPILPKIP